MKKLLFLSLLCVGMASCSGPNKLTISAIETNWGVIGPEYIQYIDKDESLTPEYKETKKRTAEMFGKLIEEAKKSFGGE
jgi:hypothetical protein